MDDFREPWGTKFYSFVEKMFILSESVLSSNFDCLWGWGRRQSWGPLAQEQKMQSVYKSITHGYPLRGWANTYRLPSLPPTSRTWGVDAWMLGCSDAWMLGCLHAWMLGCMSLSWQQYVQWISYAPCHHWDTKSERKECNNLLVSTPGRGFTGVYVCIFVCTWYIYMHKLLLLLLACIAHCL